MQLTRRLGTCAALLRRVASGQLAAHSVNPQAALCAPFTTLTTEAPEHTDRRASGASASTSGGQQQLYSSLFCRLQSSQAAMATQESTTPATQPLPRDLRTRLNAAPTATASAKDISMKAQVTFDTCWKRLEARLGDSFVCPREIVWLNGAPGSGKGTNMSWIMKSRGLSRAVGMSQLLDSSSEIRDIIDRAELVPDALVLDALLDAVLNPDLNDGAGLVIDGFPRTATQVDFVKLLFDKLLELYHRAADGPEEWRFPRPSFKVVILYVDEEESVRRQTKRAQIASLHNRRVLDAGTGDVWNVRTTDVSEALCKRRYQVFKAHYSTILRLKSYFPFSLIDAMGTLEECRSQIVRELRYQSSLDLDARTYAAIRHLPLARDLVRVARQRLVFRLDSYCKRQHRMFTDVISLISSEVLPLLKQCSLAGHAEFRSRHPLLLGNCLAVDMLIDVLSDRGFSVAHAVEERVVPRRVEPGTGEILSDWEEVHCFRITFDKENVRDLSTPASVTTRNGEDVAAIGATWVPEHMRRENNSRVEEATVRHPNAATPPQVAPLAEKRRGDPWRIWPLEKEGVRKQAGMNLTNTFEHSHAREVSVATAATRHAMQRAANVNGEEVTFLRGWDDMDAELNSATRERQYGYELMNERED